MSAGSADLAVAVELLERLVRSADAAQQQHALSLVLSGLRARCHALAAAEASDADAAPGSGGAQGGQSLAEEAALLAARLIRLAQQAPGDVCRAVAGGVCAAWASLRAAETRRGRHAACLFMGLLASTGVLQMMSGAQRRQVVADALSRLHRASGAPREDCGPGSESAPPDTEGEAELAAREAELEAELLVHSLNILTEEVLSDARALAGGELLTTQAFQGTTLLMFAALEQSAGLRLRAMGSAPAVAGQAPHLQHAHQWSEGVLQAATELSVVCAHADAQHRPRCVALLLQSLSAFGRTQRLTLAAPQSPLFQSLPSVPTRTRPPRPPNVCFPFRFPSSSCSHLHPPWPPPNCAQRKAALPRTCRQASVSCNRGREGLGKLTFGGGHGPVGGGGGAGVICLRGGGRLRPRRGIGACQRVRGGR